ncbi:hypothetical protein ACFLVH_01430 [Chloroflexota bacterium]
MVPLFILGILIIIGITVLFAWRAKLLRTDRTVARGRSERIAEEKIKDADRTEARESSERIAEEKIKENKSEK